MAQNPSGNQVEGVGVVDSIAALMCAIPLTKNDDCLFRLLMALGRILWHDPIAVELVRLVPNPSPY